jgi:hypothetical protein
MMPTSEPRVFSFETEQDLRQIAKDGFLDSTLQTVITRVCKVNGHSFGTALLVYPFRNQDFPNNIFY